MPVPADRTTLQLKRSEAAFFLERLGRRDDQRIEWRTTVIRGDRYRFVTDWSAGGQATLRPAAT
jgi:GntR family transcriptional regulator